MVFSCRLVLAVFIAGVIRAPAHDVVTTKLTWSAEISRIVNRRCLMCHNGGAKAPMSLRTYEDARPWAKAIRDEVLGRNMPPWGAVKGYGEFGDDLSLTQDEITRIAEWVEGGAPEGDPRYLPVVEPALSARKTPSGTRTRVTSTVRDVLLTGVKPLADTPDAKVRAVLPDGSIEPLIWLRNYKAAWDRTFVLREPLRLPRGTSIVSEPHISIELLVQSSTTGKLKATVLSTPSR